MTRASKKIGLLDHVGGGNLGDDATQEAVIQNIRSRLQEAEIYAFSMNPADTESRHGIRSYPIRRRTWTLGSRPETVDLRIKGRVQRAVGRYRGLFRVVRWVYALVVKKPTALIAELSFLTKSLCILRSFRMLIISGGGQLTESWGGPWQFPYTIFKWILIAKLARVERIVLNVGAGPLTIPLSKYFVRTALSLADYVSFRDAKSAQLAEQIGFKGNMIVAPDVVYSLAPRLLSPVRSTGTRGSSIVGIAPMPWGKSDLYPEKDPFVYRSLIAALGSFGLWLLRSRYQVDLFCTDIGVDPPAIADLEQTIKEARQDAAGCITIPGATTTGDLLRAMSSMDYVVTCRFHGVVFAHILNIPVIALTHHPKVATVMSDIGLEEYCLDIRAVDAKKLVDTFRSLVANSSKIKRRLEATHSAYKIQLASQFDKLFVGNHGRQTRDLGGCRAANTHRPRPGGASAN